MVSSTVPGIVHRPDDRRVADLDVAARDDAVEGGFEVRLPQVVLSAREPCRLLPQLLLAGEHFLFARAQIDLPRLEIVLRLVVVLTGGESGGPELLCALEVLSREVEGGLRAPHTDARLLEPGARGGDAGFITAHGALGCNGIDLQQELAGLDAVTFVHGETGDAAHRLRADVDGLLGVDLSGGRHDRFEIAPLHGFSRDARALLAALTEVRRAAAGNDDKDDQHQNPFPAEHD